MILDPIGCEPHSIESGATRWTNMFAQRFCKSNFLPSKVVDWQLVRYA